MRRDKCHSSAWRSTELERSRAEFCESREPDAAPARPLAKEPRHLRCCLPDVLEHQSGPDPRARPPGQVQSCLLWRQLWHGCPVIPPVQTGGFLRGLSCLLRSFAKDLHCCSTLQTKPATWKDPVPKKTPNRIMVFIPSQK